MFVKVERNSNLIKNLFSIGHNFDLYAKETDWMIL
jgi:hypothetical protein